MNETTRGLMTAMENLLVYSQPDIALALAKATATLPDGPVSTSNVLKILADLANQFPSHVETIYTCFTNSFGTYGK